MNGGPGDGCRERAPVKRMRTRMLPPVSGTCVEHPLLPGMSARGTGGPLALGAYCPVQGSANFHLF